MDWIKKALYRKLILMLFDTKLYRWLLLSVFPYVRFTCYYTSFRGWNYMRGYKYLKPGDIVVTNDKWKLTSLLVPGEWTHAALCVDIHKEFEIAEMTHTNYTKSTFFDLCKESTRVAILQCTDWDENYIKNTVIPTCLGFENVLYDIKFENDIKALYCSEMVMASDTEHRLQASNEDVLGLGMPYVSPMGIYTAKNIRVVWDSNNEKQEV